MTDNINKLMADALVECGHAKCLAEDSEGVIDGWITIRDSGYGLHEKVAPFADTLESRRQLDALFFYTLLPDKKIIISGDGHFDTREQMINHVNEHFKQLAEKSHD